MVMKKGFLKELFWNKSLIISCLIIIAGYSFIGSPLINGSIPSFESFLMLVSFTYSSCVFLSGSLELFLSIDGGDK